MIQVIIGLSIAMLSMAGMLFYSHQEVGQRQKFQQIKGAGDYPAGNTAGYAAGRGRRKRSGTGRRKITGGREQYRGYGGG